MGSTISGPYILAQLWEEKIASISIQAREKHQKETCLPQWRHTVHTSYTVNAGSSHVHINVQHKNVDGGKGNSWLTTMSTKHKICKKDYVKTASGVGKTQKQLSQG